MCDASLVKDCLPDPPTPTRRAWLRGCLMIRAIFDKCSIANLNVISHLARRNCKRYIYRIYVRKIYRNNTRFIGFLVIELYSERYVSTISRSCSRSITSWYKRVSALGSVKSQYIKFRNTSMVICKKCTRM